MSGLFSVNTGGLKTIVTATAMLALLQAPLAAPASARVNVGVTAAVIPQAAMGDTKEALKTITVGENVDQDVLIETGKRGRTQVLFIDGSSMNIGPSSRIIVDEFVFDRAQLTGNLGARVEKGSMRFIGGVLSKRADQVKFNAGKATVGIRGGIAKIAIQSDGKLLAELVHGRLSVQTPEGLFETDRIGTQIERAADGAVSTRFVSIEEVKSELDEEAKENQAATDQASDDTGAASDEAASQTTVDETATTETQTETQTEAQTTEAETSEAPVEAQTEQAADKADDGQEVTGDVLIDNPVEAGLIEIDAEGNIKASNELTVIDPQAAEMINEGALVVTEQGEIVPTEKMLEVDPTAREMFEAGYLTVSEDGLLVPSTEIPATAFAIEQDAQSIDEKIVSQVTLEEFNYVEPTLLSDEGTFKTNIASSRSALENDETVARLFELGQLEIGSDGALKITDRLDPLMVVRSSRLERKSPSESIIKDRAADRLLLSVGALDTKSTTRVVGSDIARAIYSAEVTRVVSADIVRDDAINSIERLASANSVTLPNDLKARKLDDLVSIGGALSTRDALKASLKDETAVVLLPEIIIGDTGSGQLIDYKVSNEAKVAFDLPDGQTSLTDEVITGWISRGLEPEQALGLITGDDGLARVGLVSGLEDRKSDAADLFVPTLPKEEVGNADDFDDYGRAAFIGGLGDEFIKEDSDILKSTGISSISEAVRKAGVIEDGLLIPVSGNDDGKTNEAGAADPSDNGSFASDKPSEVKPVYIAPPIAEPIYEEELVRGQIEDEIESKEEDFDLWKLNLSGQRIAMGDTQFGDPGTSAFAPSTYIWQAYNTSHSGGRSFIARESDNRVFISFDADIKDSVASYYGDNSRRTFTNKFRADTMQPSGNVNNLLALDNFSFQVAVQVLTGYTRNTNFNNEPQSQTINFTANNLSNMAAEAATVNPSVDFCACDNIATGIWRNDSFTNQAVNNITYRHQGHWAIGQPMSSDSLKRLAGMRASFEGHAVGTVVTSSLNETGYGTVAMNVDFANPTGSGNNFRLTDFRSQNYQLDDIPTVFLNLDNATGQFKGDNLLDDTVDGALYGDYRNVQAGGTFAISRTTSSTNEVSISGSFAAEVTSISK